MLEQSFQLVDNARDGCAPQDTRRLDNGGKMTLARKSREFLTVLESVEGSGKTFTVTSWRLQGSFNMADNFSLAITTASPTR